MNRLPAHHPAEFVALYPGSFKPPHAAHAHAIEHLLNHEAVGKVVVIVSNRCRPIPGTRLVIDATAAVSLFEKMLQQMALPMHRIELRVARHRAVREAMQYIGRVGKQSSLLFCVGAEDYHSSDNRFARLASMAAERNVTARIHVLPLAPRNVHSSLLREQLGLANAGPDEYGNGLPEVLSVHEKTALWAECKQRLRPIDEVIRPKLIASLKRRYQFFDAQLLADDSKTIDPVFEFRDANGEFRLVKYAGDTTGKGTFGDPLAQKPPRRLAVERRATRYLSACLSPEIFPTRVDFHDRELRVLVQKGRPPGAISLISESFHGGCSERTAKQCGKLLATFHRCPVPEKGFWSDAALDQAHWRSLIDTLASQAIRHAQAGTVDDLRDDPVRIVSRSARPQIMHMSFTLDNLWKNDSRLTIENLECAGNFGDPAYDVASMVASYLWRGLENKRLRDSLAVIAGFVAAYEDASSNGGRLFRGRVACYTAYQLLASSRSTCPNQFAGKRRRGPAVARICLRWYKQSCQ